ncbi:hypothetical protein [Nocardia sp. NPDC046763]
MIVSTLADVGRLQQDRILDLDDQITVIAEAIGSLKLLGKQEFCH